MSTLMSGANFDAKHEAPDVSQMRFPEDSTKSFELTLDKPHILVNSHMDAAPLYVATIASNLMHDHQLYNPTCQTWFEGMTKDGLAVYYEIDKRGPMVIPSRSLVKVDKFNGDGYVVKMYGAHADNANLLKYYNQYLITPDGSGGTNFHLAIRFDGIPGVMGIRQLAAGFYQPRIELLVNSIKKEVEAKDKTLSTEPVHALRHLLEVSH